jgi:hypothetical protein
VLVALAPLALLALVAPALALPPLAGLAVAFVVTTATLVLGTAGVRSSALTPPSTAARTALLGAALIVAGYALARITDATAVTVGAGLVGNAGVLLLGLGAGTFVGSRLAHPGHLPAVALASSAADVWSVHAPEGVTHALVQVADPAVQRLFALSAAVPPGRTPEALIGLGDVLFAALYLAASDKHALPRGRTVLALTVGLLLAGGATFGLQQALPALPFLGACVVLAQPRAWRIPRPDRGPTLVAALLVALALGRLWLRHAGS